MIFLAIVTLLTAGFLSAGNQQGFIPIDRIIAVVNDTIITKSDVDKSKLLFPYFSKLNESDVLLNKRVLKDLIDYRVVFLEYGGEYTLSEEDYERIQIPIINKLGSINNLFEIIRKFNMNWDDFKQFIREKVLYEKVIVEKFQMTLPVTYQEISKFYQDNYLRVQKNLHLPVKPLMDMTSLIESYLKKIKTSNRLSSWLNKLRESHRIEEKTGNLIFNGEQDKS
jgi:parvulin-like peptidyl-prolyl isomerase